ncbi:VOC family protein [Phyllobacterium myrsinacearum]|uniref:VOC family protein n=1 Tax=Phyllobacterium myrsinacearum TaxID=28101 RepID=A0A2S9JK64_9HYPH|nr:VOC family protein [Phyllobacterium myrsinacearum]PRD53462.1 VOC family protein [Phyllobacterium myrsinacearum]PWV87816.1 catechol 2,3-dioxygenase-like lactoylglutathione lyase family enzyme [Phyllobacterium myrsinacearum]RZV07914.1 catechol 2,3-dioxygenase-like lactoylglutathione lyase family enzyme [Phyllobacterium myrsinacearum]
MIGYTMIGTNDLIKSLRFYDPLMAAMDLDQCWRDGQSVSWGKRADETTPRFFVGYPFDGKAATAGNGGMTAFLFDNAAIVDRLHALAMQNGGSDEGAPGPRPHYGAGFYGAYVRDPDGNKLAFVCYAAG